MNTEPGVIVLSLIVIGLLIFGAHVWIKVLVATWPALKKMWKEGPETSNDSQCPEMVTTDGMWSIALVTDDESATGEKPYLDVARRHVVDAEKGWEYQYETVREFGADRLIEALGLLKGEEDFC